jgi:energy-coupling factor transporter ATP-binding protein EcfA2
MLWRILIMDKLNNNIKGLESFINITTNHPNLQHVYKRVMENITDISSGSVHLVFGPSGVGKTTLCKKVEQTFIKENMEHINANPGEIPIISLELPSPDNGKFNWKDFYQRMLVELKEPLINKKLDLYTPTDLGKKNIPNYLPTTAPGLRRSLENALYYRETKVVLLDESQHFLKMASGKRLQDQLDTLKSIANITQTKLVLFGTYELMQFLNLNGQLSRRTEEIHFPRYDAQNDNDLRVFRNVVNTFQLSLPKKTEMDLLDHWEFLYERSIGCVGILKNWLDRCLEKTFSSGQDFISYSTLKEFSPSPAKSIKMAEEAINGESLFSHQQEQVGRLQNILGLNKNDFPKDSSNEHKVDKPSTVGKRKPIRDKVGLEELGS